MLAEGWTSPSLRVVGREQLTSTVPIYPQLLLWPAVAQNIDLEFDLTVQQRGKVRFLASGLTFGA